MLSLFLEIIKEVFQKRKKERSERGRCKKLVFLFIYHPYFIHLIFVFLFLYRVNLAGGEEGKENAVYEVYTEAYIGRLRMTRSFGDFYLKQNSELSDEEQAVTALPEVRVHARNSTDGFLVLACDGIWDVMNNQQAVDFIGSSLGINNSNNSGIHVEAITPERVAEVCDDLLAECLTRGSGDNMSVIVIVLGTPPPQPSLLPEEEDEEEEEEEVDSEVTTPVATLDLLEEEQAIIQQKNSNNKTNTGGSTNNSRRNSHSKTTNNSNNSNSHLLATDEIDISHFLPPLSSDSPASTPDKQTTNHSHTNGDRELQEKVKESSSNKKGGKTMIQQLFAQQQQETGEGEEGEEESGGLIDSGISSPLNTAPGSSRVGSSNNKKNNNNSSFSAGSNSNSDSGVRKQLQFHE
jgi:hypothetical protein